MKIAPEGCMGACGHHSRCNAFRDGQRDERLRVARLARACSREILGVRCLSLYDFLDALGVKHED